MKSLFTVLLALLLCPTLMNCATAQFNQTDGSRIFEKAVHGDGGIVYVKNATEGTPVDSTMRRDSKNGTALMILGPLAIITGAVLWRESTKPELVVFGERTQHSDESGQVIGVALMATGLVCTAIGFTRHAADRPPSTTLSVHPTWIPGHGGSTFTGLEASLKF